jgi:dihydrofolate reductase
MKFFDIVVARSAGERAIGKNGRIPWDLKTDLKWFRELTNHQVIIMGKHTWDSLPVKPLPNRIHCILTRATEEWPPNVFAFASLEKALVYSKEHHADRQCFVIGGEGVYREALLSPWCQKVYETVLHLSVEGATAFFPVMDTNRYHLMEETVPKMELAWDKEPDDERPAALTYHRCIWQRKLPIVWCIDKSCYEREWLEECLSALKPRSICMDASETPVPNAILIANNLRSHRGLLENYHREGIPFSLIHLSDEYLDDEYHIYHSSYCIRVFRNYLHPLYLSHPKIKHFGIGYRRDLGLRECIPSAERMYAWSFAGYVRKSDRTQILDLFKPLGAHFIYETKGFECGIMEPAAYFQVMKNSKFVLCPVGNCSLDTFRLYEALEACAIPVVLCRNINQPFVRFLKNYWELLFGGEVPFVSTGSWEENVDVVRRYLTYPALYEVVLAQCRQFWENYKTQLKSLLYTQIINDGHQDNPHY